MTGDGGLCVQGLFAVAVAIWISRDTREHMSPLPACVLTTPAITGGGLGYRTCKGVRREAGFGGICIKTEVYKSCRLEPVR